MGGDDGGEERGAGMGVDGGTGAKGEGRTNLSSLAEAMVACDSWLEPRLLRAMVDF